MCDPYAGAVAMACCLWTDTPFRAGLVLSMITLIAKGIGCMD